MSEGDSIHWLARRLKHVHLGRTPAAVVADHPRTRPLRWTERLAGRSIEQIEARGKHLLVFFGDDLVLHSHLAMSGSWRIFEHGERWTRSPRNAWLRLRSDDGRDTVQFGGPTLELLPRRRLRSHPRIARLGPDICSAAWDPERAVARLRLLDPSRGVGDALLDQRSVAGIGNLWKVEACWLAGIDPWRPLSRVSDDELRAILAEARPRMVFSASTGKQSRFKTVYGTKGRPCPRCGERIRLGFQGDGARPTWWCPACQS